MKTPLILIGGGGHCRSAIDVIESRDEFCIKGIVDDRLSGEIFGYPILGGDAVLPEILSDVPYALVTVGQIRSPQIRISLYEYLLRLGYGLPTIIAASARISKYSNIGAGSIVMHGAVVIAGAAIGPNAIINNQALIDHDCIVGANCHISTGVRLNGGVMVGDDCFIGSGTIVREGVQIGAGSFVPMGSLVTQDLSQNSILIGATKVASK